MYPTFPFVVLATPWVYVECLLTEFASTIPPNERALLTINRFPIQGGRVRCHIPALPVNFATQIPRHCFRQTNDTLKRGPMKTWQIALLSRTLRWIIQNILGPDVVAVPSLMPPARMSTGWKRSMVPLYSPGSPSPPVAVAFGVCPSSFLTGYPSANRECS